MLYALSKPVFYKDMSHQKALGHLFALAGRQRKNALWFKKKKRSAGTEEERSHCYLNKNLRSLEVELISLTSWLEFNHPNIHMYM